MANFVNKVKNYSLKINPLVLNMNRGVGNNR